MKMLNNIDEHKPFEKMNKLEVLTWLNEVIYVCRRYDQDKSYREFANAFDFIRNGK